MIDKGWRVVDRAFVIEIPATTLNFRKVLGIEERGVINGKGYALMKWAEGDVDYILSDHGFTGTRRMKDRYTHGGGVSGRPSSPLQRWVFR